jgi:hypothetical protein
LVSPQQRPDKTPLPGPTRLVELTQAGSPFTTFQSHFAAESVPCLAISFGGIEDADFLLHDTTPVRHISATSALLGISQILRYRYPARMAMSTMVIISSISVKPFCFVVFLLLQSHCREDYGRGKVLP